MKFRNRKKNVKHFLNLTPQLGAHREERLIRLKKRCVVKYGVPLGRGVPWKIAKKIIQDQKAR